MMRRAAEALKEQMPGAGLDVWEMNRRRPIMPLLSSTNVW